MKAGPTEQRALERATGHWQEVVRIATEIAELAQDVANGEQGGTPVELARAADTLAGKAGSLNFLAGQLAKL